MPLAPLLAALNCAPAGDPPDASTASSDLIHRPGWVLPLGLATGPIYQDLNESLDHDSTRIMCEYAELGVKWIRIEADWPGVSPTTYQTIVRAAHAKGIKVAVVVPTTYCAPTQATCASTDPLTCYIQEYNAELDRLVRDVFSDAAGAQVDAFEIGNEPNVADPAQCGAFGYQTPNAMTAADFVSLLRGAWAWKVQRQAARNAAGKPTELIISGGILDTYTDQPYWVALVNALGSDEGIPFDEFGVHPYDMASYQATTCASGGAAGLPCWQHRVTVDLSQIAQLVQHPVFVTAFGWQDALVQPDGMKAAAQAFKNSGAVDAAFWAGYRNDATSSDQSGLRGGWDGSATPPQYPAKPSWSAFYALAHSASSGAAPDPNACWLSTGGVCNPPTPPRPPICCDANITTDCLPPGTSEASCGMIRFPDPICPPPELCWEFICAVTAESCNTDFRCGIDSTGTCDVATETPKTPFCGPGQLPGTFGCANHYCGDLVCDFGEDAVNCPSDCPWQAGDGVCGPGEPSYASDCYYCGGS